MSCRLYHDRHVPHASYRCSSCHFQERHARSRTASPQVHAMQCALPFPFPPKEGAPGSAQWGAAATTAPPLRCSRCATSRTCRLDFTREPPHAPAPTPARHWMPVVSQASRPARAMRRTSHWTALPSSDMSAAVWEPPEIPRQAPALAPRGTKRIGNAFNACPLHVRPKHFSATLHLHR